MIEENYADRTYRVIASSVSYFEWVKSLKETFDPGRSNPDSNWQTSLYEEDFVNLNNCLVIRNENYNQELLIRSTNTNPNIYVRLAQGTIDEINAQGEITGAPSIITNERRLTSTAAANTTLTAKFTISGQTLWVASYKDAISIFISDSSGSYFVYGIHAGKIFAPDNSSDEELYIDGSGIILGVPSSTLIGDNGTSGGWLEHVSSSDNYTNGRGGVIRIGENTWSNSQFVNQINQEFFSSISNRLRLVPYTVGGSNIEPAAGQIGRTKYIRQVNNNFSMAHLVLIPSEDIVSNQAWLCWSTRTASATYQEASNSSGQKSIMLWKKGPATLIDLTTPI